MEPDPFLTTGAILEKFIQKMIYERDILASIVEFVPKGDLLPTALTCKAFCEVCVVRKRGQWMTRVAENKTRLIWSINVMGLNPEGILCTKAAYKGRLDILIHVQELGYNVNKDKNIYAIAAVPGHIHILEWAREQRIPCGPKKAAAACTAATLSGNLKVLIWLRRNGFPWDKYKCLRIATFKKYVYIVDYIMWGLGE